MTTEKERTMSQTQTIVMEPAKQNATGSLVRFRKLKPGETAPTGSIVVGG